MPVAYVSHVSHVPLATGVMQKYFVPRSLPSPEKGEGRQERERGEEPPFLNPFSRRWSLEEEEEEEEERAARAGRRREEGGGEGEEEEGTARG